MSYLTEPVPDRHTTIAVAPGIRRMVADNPGPMTYHGTNSYILETDDGVVVVDPGPNEPAHLVALAQAAGTGAVAIVLTHGHKDHCAGVPHLQTLLDVPVYGHRRFASSLLQIDRPLDEGDRVFGLDIVFTPGHSADHICLARDDGTVFTGDHVMSWSSTVVPYPQGSMRDYMASLEKLAARPDRLYLCGHGPALHEPSAFIRTLLAKRLRRESDILALLSRGPRSVAEIADGLYARRHASLRLAVEHNVISHLFKLEQERKAVTRHGLWMPPTHPLAKTAVITAIRGSAG